MIWFLECSGVKDQHGCNRAHMGKLNSKLTRLQLNFWRSLALCLILWALAPLYVFWFFQPLIYVTITLLATALILWSFAARLSRRTTLLFKFFSQVITGQCFLIGIWWQYVFYQKSFFIDRDCYAISEPLFWLSLLPHSSYCGFHFL